MASTYTIEARAQDQYGQWEQWGSAPIGDATGWESRAEAATAIANLIETCPEFASLEFRVVEVEPAPAPAPVRGRPRTTRRGGSTGRQVLVRVSEEEHEHLTAAAERAGQTVPAWLRGLGLAAASQPTYLVLGRGASDIEALRVADSDPALVTHPRAAELLRIAQRRDVEVLVDPTDDTPHSVLAHPAWMMMIQGVDESDLDADPTVIAYCEVR